MRFSDGTAGMPLGIAHDASAPSCSSRRSQCSRVAWCSWITNRGSATASSPPGPAEVSPDGSEVVAKSRLAWYLRSFCDGT